MMANAFSPFVWQTGTDTFRGSVVWDSPFSPWLLMTFATVFLLLLGLQWYDLRARVAMRPRLGLCALRAAAYTLVLGMFCNPSLLIQKILQILPPLAVVFDTSGSMALADQGMPSRLQQARDYVLGGEPSALQTLQEHFQVKIYQLDEKARAISAEQVANLQPGGRTTDLLGSLATVLEAHRATPLAGMVVFSDGTHHGADTALGYLRHAGVPIVTVGVGTATGYRDIRIADVQAPTLTFVHYPAEINVKLQTWGYNGEYLPVMLKRAGRVVATKTVRVTADVFTEQVQFEVEPDEIGEFTYTVSVAPHAGEALTENNQAAFPLSVARDKIRVLLVCGSPTWNYRFLRQGLKQDPSVDLISFVILRTPTDVVNVPENQLSLIPFPTQRLFTQELKNFDVIIFENFSFQLYFPWYYLDNLRKYVHDGGAFAMVGGSLAFAQGGYAGTPIEDLLPVTLRPDRNDYRPVVHRLLLTEEGKTHPITRLSTNVQENQRIWESLPELDGLNLVGQPKPGATVLGVSNGRFEGQASAPLLAMQPYGSGRTLALMSDYVWKWNFQMAGRLDSNQYYLQFVRQMVRWLIHDPVLKQVRAMADANEFPTGSDITGTIQVLQDDYRPAENATLTPKLRTPAGVELPLQYVPTENPGEFRYRLRADEEGLYELDVQAQIAGQSHEANRLLVHVRRPGDENQVAAPNHPLLQQIAEKTNGTFFALHDTSRPTLASLVEFFGATPSYKVLEEHRLRLRETVPLFVMLLVVLGVEWWWRRRVGLI